MKRILGIIATLLLNEGWFISFSILRHLTSLEVESVDFLMKGVTHSISGQPFVCTFFLRSSKRGVFCGKGCLRGKFLFIIIFERTFWCIKVCRRSTNKTVWRSFNYAHKSGKNKNVAFFRNKIEMLRLSYFRLTHYVWTSKIFVNKFRRTNHFG